MSKSIEEMALEIHKAGSLIMDAAEEATHFAPDFVPRGGIGSWEIHSHDEMLMTEYYYGLGLRAAAEAFRNGTTEQLVRDAEYGAQDIMEWAHR